MSLFCIQYVTLLFNTVFTKSFRSLMYTITCSNYVKDIADCSTTTALKTDKIISKKTTPKKTKTKKHCIKNDIKRYFLQISVCPRNMKA